MVRLSVLVATAPVSPEYPQLLAEAEREHVCDKESLIRFSRTSEITPRDDRASAKSPTEFEVLTVEEIIALLRELKEPFRTLALMAVLLGLRRGELFGLQWHNIRFDKAVIDVQRSVVDQVSGNTKTVGSRCPLPMT